MKIERVTQKELKRRTGLSHIKGYTFPKKKTILLLAGMSRTEEKKVLAHEEEHYRKGEEGPWWALAAAAVSAWSSRQAANKAEAGAQAGIETQRTSLSETARQYDIGREQLEPYREAGEYGLGQYLEQLKDPGLEEWGGFTAGDMEEDPGYKFRLEEGYQGLDRMMAKGGKRFSGERGIGLQRYGQQMASQEFGLARARSVQDYGMRRTEGLERLSRWANLAASGQQAAGATSALGANYATSIAGINQQIAGTQQYMGQVSAAGAIGTGNAVKSGFAGMQYQQNLEEGYYN